MLGPQKVSQKENFFVNLAEFFAKSQTPRLSGGSNEPQNEPLNGPLNETLNLLTAAVKTVYDAVKTNPGIRRAGIVARTGLNLPAVKRAIGRFGEKCEQKCEQKKHDCVLQYSTCRRYRL